MTVAAVVPVWREDPAQVAATVAALTEIVAECCVVIGPDDPNMYLEVVGPGVNVMLAPGPGLACAYRYGWQHFARYDRIVHVDIGHGIDDVERTIAASVLHDADLTVGSRFVAGAAHLGPWKRRAISRAAAALARTATFGPYRDWTSGLRVWSTAARAAARDAGSSGHAWQIETLARIHAAGLHVVETPITYVPSNSALSVARTLEAGDVLWRLAWTR